MTIKKIKQFLSFTKIKKKIVYKNGEVLKNYSRLNQEELLDNLNLSNFALSEKEVNDRLELFGPNSLKNLNFRWFFEFIKAYFGPFNLILSVIVCYNLVSYFVIQKGADRQIYDVIGAGIVGAMIILSGTMCYVQCIKTFFVTKKLTSIVINTATAIRNTDHNEKSITKENYVRLIRQAREITVKELVPGDLIYLSAGDMVPADVRILISNDIYVNQSSLTGESIPAEKHAYNDHAEFNNLFELQNICFMGSSVISGSGLAVVLATGVNTYFSTISESIMQKRPVNSFTKGIRTVTILLTVFMAVMVPIVLVINGMLKHDWMTALLFAISVAVGLTPEMLPMIVTSNLAHGASKMAKKKIVVKQLAAIQNLGAIDVLCTDKTGTLTNDKIELVEYTTLDHKKNDTLLRYVYLNSYFQTGLKNPLDAATINYAQHKKGFSVEKHYTKIDEIPFDFHRRRLTIITKEKDQKSHTIICKGAVEEVMKACTHVIYKDRKVAITKDILRQVESYTRNLNQKGLRAIAVAYREDKHLKEKYTSRDEKDLIFLGFVGFLDTPKPSSAKMVHLLEKHGIDLKILTGDNLFVTQAICDRVHFKIKGTVSGEELENLAQYELCEIVEKNNIFYKLSPLQKVKIIEALKLNDHIVGFMGDGINDAPVLMQSDVGISVDNATDIAKESSDIILLEKSLLVLENGIIEGRHIFGNILKYIKITIASNFGNVFSVLIASAWLTFTPIAPIQLLFQNLLYDISQFAIIFDRVDKSFLLKPQRWTIKGMVPFAFINGPVSSIFDVATFLILGYSFGVIGHSHDPNMVNMFNSGWFIEGLLTQIVVVQMFRTEKIPFFQSRATWQVNVMAVLICAFGVALPYTYLGAQMQMQGPPLIFLPIMLGLVVLYCVFSQFTKIGYIKLFKKWL